MKCLKNINSPFFKQDSKPIQKVGAFTMRPLFYAVTATITQNIIRHSIVVMELTPDAITDSSCFLPNPEAR